MEKRIEIRLEDTLESIQQKASTPEEREELVRWTSQYQNMTNYRYWRMRSLAERERETTEAHKDLYDAGQAYINGDTPKAEELAFKGLAAFEKITEKYPDILEDSTSTEEIILGHMIWRDSYKQNHTEDLPEQFPLRALWVKSQPAIQMYEKEFLRRYGSNNQ